MALWKPFRGSRTALDSVEKHDGYVYFCIDDGSLFFDYVDSDGNLQRKQINAKDAETLMGMSLEEIKKYVAVQSDWSVNDENDSAYIKNRTHWVEITPTVFIDNEVLAFSAQSETLYAHFGSVSYTFAIDAIYQVVWDETTYECTCFEYQGIPALGNTNIVGLANDNATEPFLMYTANGTLVMATNSTDTSHTLTLFGDVTTYHTIDKNYLPKLIGQSGTGANSEIFNDYSGYNVAEGEYAHSEGFNTKAMGNRSHAEGWITTASGHNSHAEGSDTTASGAGAHAEGSGTEATGRQSHAEGDSTIASGASAHTEGYATETRGNYAHAEGMGTIAGSVIQHAQGKYNVVDSAKKYAHIVGNGDDNTSRSNAHTLDWSGNAWFAGDVKVGGVGQDDSGAKTLATTDYVDSKASDWEILMDTILEEECVDVIGPTLTDTQKERIANGGDFVCYVQCPPPSECETQGWIQGGLWANNMYYFILSAYGQLSSVVPSATSEYTLKLYSNIKNASGDIRIRDMFYTLSTKFEYYDFFDATEFMTNYQTQPLTVRFKTNGMFAVGTRLVCKVR